MKTNTSLEADTLSDALRVRCTADPSRKPWLIIGNQSWSHARARDEIGRIARLFATWGLEPGDRLLIATASDAAMAVFAVAGLSCGIGLLVIDPDARFCEIGDLIQTAGPKAALVDPHHARDWCLPASVHYLQVEPRPPGGGAGSLLARLRRRRPSSPSTYPGILATLEPMPLPSSIDDAQEAYVLCTSGSTGRSKGVCISRTALMDHVKTLVRQFGYTADSRILNVLPLHNTDGLVQSILVTWLLGATALRPMPFDVGHVPELLDVIYRERATDMIAVPTMLSLMLRMGSGREDAFHGGDFRNLISTAGLLNVELWNAFESTFGIRVSNFYGMTETVTGACFCGPDDATFLHGTVGKAVDCETRVAAPDGSELPAGEEGELWIRGSNTMIGYLGDEQATAAAMHGDWLRTGDLATIDEEGYVRIVGRLGNVIITAGRNIMPEEITAVLERFPEVAEAVTFSLPDEMFGEIAVSSVVPAEGVQPDSRRLVEQCHRYLSAYKIPKSIRFVEHLPRGPSGKVVIPRARSQFEKAAREAACVPRDGNELDTVLEAAATAFGHPRSHLDPRVSPDRIAGWDSFAHLRFVDLLEQSFSVRLTTAEIMRIQSIDDAHQIILKKA